MKIVIVVVVLIALYLSFFLGQGLLYDSSLDVFNWLSTGHGKAGYFALLITLGALAIYLFKLEWSDKEKQRQITDLLIHNIKENGVYATAMEDTGFGEVHLKAMINFEDSAFVLKIKQNTNSDAQTTLVEKRFLSWRDLTIYIDRETRFEIVDFLPKVSPEYQVPHQNDVVTK